MGERLGGDRFELIRELGRGGMGIVYEAIDHRDGARVALKTLRHLTAQDVYRLKQEFRALRDVEHPNLVGIRELAEDDGHWFFTMELVAGTDFLDHVRDAAVLDLGTAETADGTLRPFEERRLRDALRGLAVAVAALHETGLVHRDIKPSNIRVTPEGTVVLLDFGLAADAVEAKQSGEGLVVGTPLYMAPEQAASRPAGPAADWYAVGVVLYEALTGTAPFSGTALKVAMDKQHHDAPAPSTVAPGTPEDLDRLTVELLRIDPAERPGASEILARLGGPRTPTGSVSRRTLAPALFGRARELAVLEGSLAGLRAGAPVTVHVSGESGVGKSALVGHFVAELTAREPNAVVLRGRCYEREWVPYKGLDGVVDSLSRYLCSQPDTEQHALLPRHATLLPRVFPVLGRVEAIARAPRPRIDAVEDRDVRSRAFAALRELLIRLTERALVVITIDDLHWADPDSLLLLGELLRPPDAPALLVVGTSRQRVASSGDGATHIDLTPLDPTAARQLARTLLEREGLEGVVSPAMLASEAGGHPLYVNELVRYVAMRGDAVEQAAPPKLDDAIRARVELLPEPARRVMYLAVVAGVPVPDLVLSAASRASPDEVTRALAVLRAGSLLRSRRDGAVDVAEPYTTACVKP